MELLLAKPQFFTFLHQFKPYERLCLKRVKGHLLLVCLMRIYLNLLPNICLKETLITDKQTIINVDGKSIEQIATEIEKQSAL